MNRVRRRTLWLALGLMAGLHPAARGAGLTDGPLELDAVQGEIVHADGPAPGSPGSPGSLRGALRFLELRGGGRWAPSAFVGIRDDAQEGKFRAFITQPERGGAVVAGFDYVLDGATVLREAVVKNIPRTAAVEFALTWDRDGTVTVSFFGEALRSVRTALRPRVLFAAASSAKAKFVLAADSFL